MLSLSTSWNSSKHDNGFDLIGEITAMGFGAVELNFALTESVVKDCLAMKESGRIKISSLHNMCPLPDEIEPARATPDFYSLSSTDDRERRRAVEIAKNTIDYAVRLGAGAVVLHAGRVEIRDRTRELAGLAGDVNAFTSLRDEMMAERRAQSGVYFDNVMKSLDELVPYAARAGVGIGIENRYYYREIPIAEEMDAIFRRFEKGLLYYWHDVGHAEVFDRLGLTRHKDLLDKFSDRLIGIHLHDIIGNINDHKAPGKGTFDFSLVKPFIGKDTIKVMEVHQPATAEEIRGGVTYLQRTLGEL